jgi:subtilisin family serine protease
VLVAGASMLLLGAPPRSTGGSDGPPRWDLTAIGAPAAWARGATGAGSIVAIVDSGIDLDHPELTHRIVGGATCLGTGGDPGGCVPGGDDVEGHGTHVAGIAAATAPRARLLAVRVLSAGCAGCPPHGAADDVAAGIGWAVARGADVVNLSVDTVDGALAGPAMRDAVEGAWAAGAVVVAASGNRSGDGTVAQPALVVTGTDRDGALATYAHGAARSPWGLAAPGGSPDAAPDCRSDGGTGVASTWIGGGQRCLSGTSMAAPHVAGAVADLRSLGYDPAGAVDRLIGSTRAIRADGAAGVGALDLAAASGPGPVVDPIVGWPRPEADAAAPGTEAAGELLPPVFGGAVMGLCGAVALFVLRDIQRARRRARRQSLASASV